MTSEPGPAGISRSSGEGLITARHEKAPVRMSMKRVGCNPWCSTGALQLLRSTPLHCSDLLSIALLASHTTFCRCLMMSFSMPSTLLTSIGYVTVCLLSVDQLYSVVVRLSGSLI